MHTFLNSSLRDDIGSNAAGRIRSHGHIPGIIYGHYFSNYPLEFDKKELNRLVRQLGENAVVNVDINGTQCPAMIKAIQRDPVTGEMIHIDFQQVSNTEKIHTSIPVVLIGKNNLEIDTVIQQQLHKIDVECYPDSIPKSVAVDISKLAIGSSLRVSDVEFAEDLGILNQGEEVILSLSESKQELEEEEESVETNLTAEEILRLHSIEDGVPVISDTKEQDIIEK